MSRPKSPCLRPGCGELVDAGYCNAHKPPPSRKHTPEADRFYSSSRWQAIRAIVRRAQPICMECKRAPSQSVDHISGDINDNRFDAGDPLNSNLRAVCNRCHAAKSGLQHWRKRAS